MGKENTTDAKGEPAVASTALLAALKTTGFEACEYGGVCEKCGKVSATLYFGNPDYWDCREGDTWCGQCVIDRHTTNEQDYASAVGGQVKTKKLKRDLLTLRIRNLIAAREFNTAAANRELQCGDGWLCDHGHFDRELAAEIDNLLKQANICRDARREKEKTT